MMLERIRVSENRRFLVTDSGESFFWLGDTAWELFHRCSLEDAELYLDNRQERGFNVVQAVALAELDGLNTPNVYGELPLHDNDPTTPNEAYFRHMDALIQMAAERDIYVGLLPTWGDKVNLMWGRGPAIFNAENARAYGHWLANRYRDQPNILWINGGDRPEQANGVDYAPVWRALAAGIRDGLGSDALITYHPNGGRGSSMSFHNDDWLDVNMWQSGHLEPDLPNWEYITQDYHRTPTKPVLDGEPNYEDHPINPFTRQWLPEYGYFRDYDVRRQAYRAVFAGACGHTYGHHAVWQFYTPERTPINIPDRSWQDAITRPGAAQMMHLKNLMLSRPYLTRVPAQEALLSDAGDRASHRRVTRDADGSYLMAYLPQAGQTVTLRTALLSGETLQVWWYDPRTGEADDAGTFLRTETQTFTSPDSGPDWVLVLDDAARDFNVPGGV
ncbi:MAG: glycoside hydrolase family 140 protein [Chloroflexi bacterium]|nr:glycoside hydrolase family 140 protein [Chloroflexota bacterium]